MSKEYQAFTEETGETAFLAGVIDVLSDTLSLACDSISAFDADIFCVPDLDLTVLDDTVKKRLKAYNQYMKDGYIKQEDIDSIHFELEKIEEDVTTYACRSFQKYSFSSSLREAVIELRGI